MNKVEALKNMIKNEKTDLVLLQETKMQSADLLALTGTIWAGSQGVPVKAQGASGGIATIVSSKFNIISSVKNNHWMTSEIKTQDSNSSIFICNVYGPIHHRDKVNFWEDLSNLKDSMQGGKLIIVGDFNVKKSQQEKRGGSIVCDPFGERLEDLLVDLDLIDIPLKNAKYTWNNRRCGAGHIAARIDRFLVCSAFFQSDLLINSYSIPCASSDHNPIGLSIAPPENLGPIPFRFNHLWINTPGFLDIVKNTWNKNFPGSPSFIWESKLRVVKIELKKWAKTSYKNPSSTRLIFQSKLSSLHQKMDNEEITTSILSHEKNIELDILRAAKQEEEIWRIKSRQLWLKGGDNNTRYFHNQSKARRSHNVIKELKNSNGERISR